MWKPVHHSNSTCLLSLKVILLAVVFLSTSNKADVLPEDRADEPRSPCTDPGAYAPCTCDRDTNGNVNIECNEISLSDVKTVMNNTINLAPNYVNYLTLYLPASSDMEELPENLLSGRKVTNLYIYCPSSRSMRLKAHIDSLRSSENHTRSFYMTYCDMVEMDYAFFTNFNTLDHFGLYTASNIQTLESLPPLDRLTDLYIRGCAGFDGMNFPAESLYSLTKLYLEDNNKELGDIQLELILNAITSSVAATLTTLSLKNNFLKFIPSQILLMTGLKSLNVEGNQISVIQKNSLQDIQEIRLNRIGLTQIWPGAFIGNFSQSKVSLNNNQLNRMEEQVFLNMLQDMKTSGVGILSVDFNPIECDCSISWLVRENRQLMTAVKGGTCSNYTTFEQLNPEGFSNCTLSFTDTTNNRS